MRIIFFISFFILFGVYNPASSQQLSKKEEKCKKIGVSKIKKNKKQKTKSKKKISLYKKEEEEKKIINPKFR